MNKRFYIRRAMGLDPRVIEKDFESEPILDQVEEVAEKLKTIDNRKELWAYNDETAWRNPEEGTQDDGRVLELLRKLWYPTDVSYGINLRDREKLYPLFKELGRLFGTAEYPYAYRGVSIPESVYGKKFLDKNYIPGEPISPLVRQVLENLAYGLRSWAYTEYKAKMFATKFKSKQPVVFVLKNPNVILDGDNFIQKSNYYNAVDQFEIVLYLRDPKVLSIEKIKNVYFVTVTDN